MIPKIGFNNQNPDIQVKLIISLLLKEDKALTVDLLKLVNNNNEKPGFHFTKVIEEKYQTDKKYSDHLQGLFYTFKEVINSAKYFDNRYNRLKSIGDDKKITTILQDAGIDIDIDINVAQPQINSNNFIISNIKGKGVHTNSKNKLIENIQNLAKKYSISVDSLDELDQDELIEAVNNLEQIPQLIAAKYLELQNKKLSDADDVQIDYLDDLISFIEQDNHTKITTDKESVLIENIQNLAKKYGISVDSLDELDQDELIEAVNNLEKVKIYISTKELTLNDKQQLIDTDEDFQIADLDDLDDFITAKEPDEDDEEEQEEVINSAAEDNHKKITVDQKSDFTKNITTNAIKYGIFDLVLNNKNLDELLKIDYNLIQVEKYISSKDLSVDWAGLKTSDNIRLTDLNSINNFIKQQNLKENIIKNADQYNIEDLEEGLNNMDENQLEKVNKFFKEQLDTYIKDNIFQTTETTDGIKHFVDEDGVEIIDYNDLEDLFNSSDLLGDILA